MPFNDPEKLRAYNQSPARKAHRAKWARDDRLRKKLGYIPPEKPSEESRKAARREYEIEYRKRNRESIAEYRKNTVTPAKRNGFNLKSKYGITVEMYDEMYEAQGGVCKICSRPETLVHHNNGKIARLSVDHNHETGQVRGLLCRKCNTGLGLFGDSIDVVGVALRYLEGG